MEAVLMPFLQEPEFTVLVGFVLLMLSRIVFCWIIGCPFVLFHLANLLPTFVDLRFPITPLAS